MITNTFSSHIRSVSSGLFLVLVFLVVFLPTGSVFGINVKVISLGAFLVAFMLYLIFGRDGLLRSEIVSLTIIGACLCFWILVGVLNGQADMGEVFYQVRDVASAILIAWLSLFSIRRGLVRAESLITTVIYGLFFLSCLKLVLIVGMFAYNIDPVQAVQSIFGQLSLVTGDAVLGLFRIEFPADILGAFALFALLARSVSGVRLGRLSTAVILFVLLGSGFVAFSRYIWLLYFVAIVLAMIVDRRWKMLVVSVVAVLAISSSFYDAFNTIFAARFLSNETEISDVIRAEQSRALIGEIEVRPILGKGLGTHVNTNIRSELHMYSYELQWLAFLMQFGIIGMAGILLLVAASARDLVAARHPAKLWIFLLFLLWLLASWTNPYLTSSFAGATFGLFIAIFHRLRNAANNPSAPRSLTPSLQPR